MVTLDDDAIYARHAEQCKTFSNARRLKLVDALRDGERTVTELTETCDIPQPTISQHLKVMRDRDIVERRKVGVESHYSLTDDRISQAVDLMRELMIEQTQA